MSTKEKELINRSFSLLVASPTKGNKLKSTSQIVSQDPIEQPEVADIFFFVFFG